MNKQMPMPGEGAEWFLKPGDKLEQNLLKASEDYRQALMAAGPEVAGPEAAMLEAMKKSAGSQRPKSMLEKHQVSFSSFHSAPDSTKLEKYRTLPPF